MKLTAIEGHWGYACTPATCNPGCALGVIDDLLRATTAVCGHEIDSLLDLRSILRHRQDAAAALALFCSLRRAMEERHYLPFYRLRRWLENQIEVHIRIRRGDEERVVPLRIDRFCLEAICSQCLETARQPEEQLWMPKVRFSFRSLPCPLLPENPGKFGRLAISPG